ncbi:MAG: glutaredoxin domain-containing protein, partial [Chromatocurvus sp.]
MQDSNAPALKVYWQPGCSSCLRAKEFLTEHNLPFESINVREGPRGMQELAELGLRTVPVVRRGDQFVLGQSLQELADFVGISNLPEGLN